MASMTSAELATELETTPRTLRKFLRSVTPKENQPGKGSRWSIEKRDLRKLRKQFSDWKAAQDAAREDAAETVSEETE